MFPTRQGTASGTGNRIHSLIWLLFPVFPVFPVEITHMYKSFFQSNSDQGGTTRNMGTTTRPEVSR